MSELHRFLFEGLPVRGLLVRLGEGWRALLHGLGRGESEGLIAERGEVEVGCDFCGAQYRFDAVDVGELFTPGRDQPPSSAAVQ
jgi:molecular chaperone Hsp33